jgi:hypothetical protein
MVAGPKSWRWVTIVNDGRGSDSNRGDGSSGEWRKTGAERLIQILELMTQGRNGRAPRTLCATAAEIVGVSGAGIALVSSGGTFTRLCTSNDVSAKLMEIELTVGEGPCLDVCATNGSLSVPNLLSYEDPHWLAFAPLAGSSGARAVFGFPIRIGAARLGALSLYRDRSGSLTDVQTSDAYLMASVASRAILSMQSGAPPEMIATELEHEATFDFAIHQAAGMVAVQGSMSIGDALATLRAHAFSTSATPSALARRIVARDTFFDPVTRDWRELDPR